MAKSDPEHGQLVEQVLCRAHEIISSGRWIQGDIARTKNGRLVDPESKIAANFCSVGAVRRAQHELGLTTNHRVAVEAFKNLARVLKSKGYDPFDSPTSLIVRFNDSYGRSASQVEAMFCGAINLTRKEPGLKPPKNTESTL